MILLVQPLVCFPVMNRSIYLYSMCTHGAVTNGCPSVMAVYVLQLCESIFSSFVQTCHKAVCVSLMNGGAVFTGCVLCLREWQDFLTKICKTRMIHVRLLNSRCQQVPRWRSGDVAPLWCGASCKVPFFPSSSPCCMLKLWLRSQSTDQLLGIMFHSWAKSIACMKLTIPSFSVTLVAITAATCMITLIQIFKVILCTTARWQIFSGGDTTLLWHLLPQLQLPFEQLKFCKRCFIYFFLLERVHLLVSRKVAI